jgi:gliding motility-associated-like protein
MQKTATKLLRSSLMRRPFAFALCCLAVLYAPVQVLGQALQITGDSLVCTNETYLYRASGTGNFTWEIVPSGAGVFTDGTGATGQEVTIRWAVAGNATLRVTQTSNQQTATRSVSVGNLIPAPAVPFEPVVELGEEVILTASGQAGAVFRWYLTADLDEPVFTGAVFRPNINPTFTGTVRYFVTQTLGSCTSAATPIAITIVLTEVPTPDLQSAEGTGNFQITLKWVFNAAADTFYIERATDPGGPFVQIKTFFADGLSLVTFTDDTGDLELGITYYYRVRAWLAESNRFSEFSQVVSARVNFPPVPRDVTFTGENNRPIFFDETTFLQAFVDLDADDTLVAIQLVSFPSNGTLNLGNVQVIGDQIVPLADIDRLNFQPAPGWFGETLFAYRASDGKDFSEDLGLVNLVIAPPPPRPDLQPVAITITPDDLLPGDFFRVKVTIRNNSATPAPPYLVSIVFASDSILFDSDEELIVARFPGLAGNQTDEGEFSFSLPNSIDEGTYYIFAVVDPRFEFEEEDKDNNNMYAPVRVRRSNRNIQIMNVATPNGDGKNDFLHIQNIDLFPDHTIWVLDKWGKEIYRSSNYQNDWGFTGSSGTLLPPGNYICLVEIRGDSPITLKEIITVLWE